MIRFGSVLRCIVCDLGLIVNGCGESIFGD
jgi:hypothetical protein